MTENVFAQSIENRKRLENISDNYLSIWNGDLSLIGSTFAPKFAFHADRFPSPDGSQAIDISTPDDFRGFVSRARNGWDKYEFEVLAWAGDGNNVAVRWKLNAVMGANFTILPTTLKQGDTLTYNGTDFLTLNQNSGLIEELSIAQDLITLFHNLGLSVVGL